MKSHETLYSFAMVVRGCSTRQLALLMDAVGAGSVRSTYKPDNTDLGDADKRSDGERDNSIDGKRIKLGGTDCKGRVLQG